MNAPLRPTEAVPHRFTADEVFALAREGAFGDARFELIDGRLFDMPADGPLHVSWSARINWWINAALGLRYVIVPNATLRLGDEDMPSPDWHVFPLGLPVESVRGSDVLLAVEQADSSFRRDMTVKAGLYAKFGVRDYWVIELESERVHVHRDPTPEGYASVQAFGREQAVDALLIPGLSLRIADLPRVG